MFPLSALLLFCWLIPLCAPFAADPHQWPPVGVQPRPSVLPICRVCACNRHLRSVECVPRGDGQQFRLNLIRLPGWAESFTALNISLPSLPHFLASAPSLRLLRVLHCGLRKVHPLSLVPLPALESLQLSGNAIEEVPAELLLSLSHLRSVDLSDNRLASPTLHLPAGRVLDQLDLSGNPLCPQPDAYWPPARQLRLNRANLVALDSNLWTFGSDGGTDQQQRQSVCRLSLSASHWDSLEQLRLGSNPRLRVSAYALSRLTSVHQLDLSGAKSLPEELFTRFSQQPVEWRHLDLRGAHFEVMGGDSRRNARWRVCSAQLEWLDVSALQLDGVLRLDGCRGLKWLYADDNLLEDIQLGDSGPEALVSLSAQNNRLRRFPSLLSAPSTLSSLQLANNSIRFVPDDLLEQYPALSSLDLASNRLRHFQLLLSPMEATPHGHLAFLNLSGNLLTAFEPLPGQLSSLSVLDISRNRLEQFGHLDRLPSLEHLHLSGNPALSVFDAGDFEHVALVQLDLANCSFDEAPKLSGLRALRELDLSRNQLAAVSGERLPLGVGRLDLGGNKLRRLGWDWGEEQIDALQQLGLQANPLECACAMPAKMAEWLRAHEQHIHDRTAYFCLDAGHWPHPLDAFLPRPADASSLSCSLRFQHFHRPLSADEEHSVLLLFLVPLVLICGAIAGAVLLLRGRSLDWEQWAKARRHSSLFAYEPVPPAAESV